MPAITQGHTPNNINKTVLFPVPTDLYGQEIDEEEVGIATYIGPRYLRTRWQRPNAEGVVEREGSQGVWDWEDPSGIMPCPADCVEVKLDAEVHTLQAMMRWGQAYPGERMEVVCGPADIGNPDIEDPYSVMQALDPRSAKYDTVNECWCPMEFGHDAPNDFDPENGTSFSWKTVRQTRDCLLSMSDAKVAANDVPDSVKQPWIDYRQRLRDLPTEWAGVGTSTYLIVWPMEPDVAARGTKYGARPVNGRTH